MSAIHRWDAFLAQIQARHRDVLVAAETDALRFVAQIAGGGDPAPLSHQLMAARARLLDLQSKIIDTWHSAVEDAILADGHWPAVRDREFVKGLTLQRALDDEREELEPRIFAELARQRFAQATAASRFVACTWCNAWLPAPMAFRLVEVVCNCCRAVMTFEPGELMRSVAAVGAHAIAQEAAVHDWREMRAAERRMHDLRPPRPLDAVVAYERSQILYWRTYLATRAQLEPELARDPAHELRARMEPWYTHQAEFEEAWVRAGRPRTPITP